MKRDFFTSGTTLIRYRGDDECVEIPEGITVIYENAFRDLKNAKSVALPSTIETIIRCYPRKYELFKKMPEWNFNKIGRLSSEIAELIDGGWLKQMNPYYWAVLYLTQNSPAFKDLFEKHMSDVPNEYLSEMIKLLEESDKTDMFTRAAEYAAEYRRELKRQHIEELYALVMPNKRAESAGEILNSLINPKEIDKSSPYAWLYEKFDEPKLLKRYRDFGGKVKGLCEVLSTNRKEYVPAIAVLAVLVPYLEFFDKKLRFGSYNRNIKLYPESDRALELIDRASLIAFINKNTDIKNNSRRMYPYCRYASEQEIKELISSRKKAAQKQKKRFHKKKRVNLL